MPHGPIPDKPEEAAKYDAAILLNDDGALLGEPDWAFRQAEAAGIIYHCAAEDGSCGHGIHTSTGVSGFWHYMPGKTGEDYDRVTEAETSAQPTQ